MFIQDPGDTHDEVKWNFSEDDIPVFYVDNDPYPYKATSYENAIILGKKRASLDEWPVEISKYKEYPERMIDNCKSMINNSSNYGSINDKANSI